MKQGVSLIINHYGYTCNHCHREHRVMVQYYSVVHFMTSFGEPESEDFMQNYCIRCEVKNFFKGIYFKVKKQIKDFIFRVSLAMTCKTWSRKIKVFKKLRKISL